jgi:hypothetical protein
MIRSCVVLLLIFLPAVASAQEPKKDAFPPGWLPVHRLDDKTPWEEVRKIDDKVLLYLPHGDKTVRGVFLSVVFHSGDPRECAKLWNFALVTIPWPMLWDIGLPDKRSPRAKKTGLPMGDMGVMLQYLEAAAKETKHPELAAAPIVGWMMQGGNHHLSDLHKRVPDRIIAWVDAFPNQIAKYPDLTKDVPFALAWEESGADKAERKKAADAILSLPKDRLTPPVDLKCRATTYGFAHGIYSKWNFFMAFLHRLILLRLPNEAPPLGQPTKLRPIRREDGWAGDFNPVSEWNPIAPFAKARGMITPTWLPDEYMAWSWRAYHAAKPDIKLTAPIVEYRSKGDRKDCGLGYGNVMKAGTPLTFAAETTGTYTKIEFHDGDKIVGAADKAPWRVEGVRLERGLRVLFAVGVTRDGERKTSRAAFLVVE